MDTVPLIKEIEHANTYLNIQHMRFRNILTVHQGKFPKELSSFLVPRLMLQPIIENAFSHGLKDVEKPYLSIRYLHSSSDFSIVVEDNGNSLTEEMYDSLKAKLDSNDLTMETTAIINIHRRLKLHFGKDSGIHIDRRDDGGLTVTICIKNMGDDYHVSNSNS